MPSRVLGTEDLPNYIDNTFPCGLQWSVLLAVLYKKIFFSDESSDGEISLVNYLISV